jgi:hypothetical protein
MFEKTSLPYCQLPILSFEPCDPKYPQSLSELNVRNQSKTKSFAKKVA